MTWARRVDTTHKPIMEALRAAGFEVLDVSRLKGFCDLVVWRRDDPATVRLVECKDRLGKPTAAQKGLLARGCPIVTLRTVEDAVRLR
jgi:hypothetical protein